MTENMRPGVTVEYTTLPAVGQELGRAVGIAAAAGETAAGAAPEMVKLCSLAEGLERFGKTGELPALLRAVFDNAVCEVYAVQVQEGNAEQLRAGLSLLFAAKEPYCILSSPAEGELLAFAAEEAERYGKLYFGTLAVGKGAADYTAAAHEVNSGRVLLALPEVFPLSGGVNVSSALLAAVTARQESPLSNLFGEEALGDYEIVQPLGEEELNRCLAEGVTVFEPGSLAPEVVRAVTTRTSPDLTRRNLSVTILLDRVTGALREALQKRIALSPVSLSDVAAVLEWELFLQKEAGLISGYDKPEVTADLEDASLCRAAVCFRVKQGLAQVAVTAQIEV